MLYHSLPSTLDFNKFTVLIRKLSQFKCSSRMSTGQSTIKMFVCIGECKTELLNNYLVRKGCPFTSSIWNKVQECSTESGRRQGIDIKAHMHLLCFYMLNNLECYWTQLKVNDNHLGTLPACFLKIKLCPSWKNNSFIVTVLKEVCVKGKQFKRSEVVVPSLGNW